MGFAATRKSSARVRALTLVVICSAATTGIVARPAPSGAVSTVASGTPTVVVTRNAPYGPEAVELADIYRSSGQIGLLPALLIVHGGGWQTGSKEGWIERAEQFAAAGFVAVVVDYRLASPTVRGFPHQLHELKQAISWMRSDASELRIDPARIGAIGSSSGGNLVAMLATDAIGPLDSGDRIRAAVTWSAMLDLRTQPRLTSAIADYVGCSVDCQSVLAEASPIKHVSGGDTPIELFNSSTELVPVSHVWAMDSALTAHHVFHKVVIYQGHLHGVSYGDQAMASTINFLNQELR